jgi:hypothetical protein
MRDSRRLEDALSSIRKQMDAARETALHLAEAFGVFEAGKKLVEMAHESMELGEELVNLNAQTGISTDHLQVLDLAVQATGASMDRLALVVTRLHGGVARGRRRR